MAWMLDMGDNPYTSEYVVRPDVIVQGSSQIKVLDMFRECSLFW